MSRVITIAGESIQLTGGYSQLEMSVIAKGMGIANLTDAAFLKRFAKCKDWLEWMVSEVRSKKIIEYAVPEWLNVYTLVALDASDVSEKGRSRRVFRLHYAIDFFKLCGLSYKITSQKVGEKLANFDIKTGWLILADRIYGTLTGMEHCLTTGADLILRLRHNAFKLFDNAGNELKLLDWLQNITCETAGNLAVFIKLSKVQRKSSHYIACGGK